MSKHISIDTTLPACKISTSNPDSHPDMSKVKHFINFNHVQNCIFLKKNTIQFLFFFFKSIFKLFDFSSHNKINEFVKRKDCPIF